MEGRGCFGHVCVYMYVRVKEFHRPTPSSNPPPPKLTPTPLSYTRTKQAHALPGPPHGVSYIPDFVLPELEAAILAIARAVPDNHPAWVRVRGRRLQCYGGACVFGRVCTIVWWFQWWVCWAVDGAAPLSYTSFTHIHPPPSNPPFFKNKPQTML